LQPALQGGSLRPSWNTFNPFGGGVARTAARLATAVPATAGAVWAGKQFADDRAGDYVAGQGWRRFGEFYNAPVGRDQINQ
jgi:hypothetical protein